MNLSKFTVDGKFLMLALDHRESFKKLISPNSPDIVSDEQVVSLKSGIIEALQDQFSGLLIDEHYGLEACKEACQLKPFLLPVEKSGYINQAGERITELEYNAEQLIELGASGAKILIYFNPNLESAQKQLETAKIVMEDCQDHDFPYFLEIVTFGKGENLVIESIKKFIESGVIPSVWKLEYPGSLEKCQEVTNLTRDNPWILLSGGQTFDQFKPEVETAIKGGAKGFLAGRALWQEVCTMEGSEKQKFLEETLPDRFKEIATLAGSSH